MKNAVSIHIAGHFNEIALIGALVLGVGLLPRALAAQTFMANELVTVTSHTNGLRGSSIDVAGLTKAMSPLPAPHAWSCMLSIELPPWAICASAIVTFA